MHDDQFCGGNFDRLNCLLVSVGRWLMASLYKLTCSACNYTSPAQSGHKAAVIVDEPSSSNHVHPDNDRLVILAHPLESLILKELGISWGSTAFGGRGMHIHCVICRECGTIYEIRRLSAGLAALGCSGCFTILGLSVGIGILAGWQLESIWLGVVAGWLGLWALETFGDWAIARHVRRRFQDRVREFDRGPGCPRCGSTRFADFRPRREAFPCPKCTQHDLRVRCVGRS